MTGAARQVQQLPPEEVFTVLGSRRAGLTSAEVAERRLEVGRNSVEIPDPWKWVRQLRRQFTNFFPSRCW